MAAIVDDYLDASAEMEDVFPCKGCGEILEEGKAFELAGNRWHLDCFRCNTCGTLLDSDANLLLLGDGSLICNNCTYSCSACGNKIEDLAILTGDQAFCSTCFRCRNCKRKIENLRYARTSQGIFCMGCHESLMARRRKKSKAAAAAKLREKEHSPMVTEKSLPALPPNVIPNNAFSNDRVDPDSDRDTPTELSPRPQPVHRHTSSSSQSNTRSARSPERQAKPPEGLGLSSHPYRNNRNSTIIGNESGADDGFFIPVALDPSPGPGGTPRSGSEAPKKEPFSTSRPSLAEKRTDSQSSTPHIAFQEKPRQQSENEVKPLSRKLSKSSRQDHRQSTNSGDEKTSTLPLRSLTGPEEFKLQDAPKNKRLVNSGSNSSQSSAAAQQEPKQPGSATSSRYEKEGLPLSETWGVSEPAPRSSQDSRRPDEDSKRPSLDSNQRRPSNSKSIPRKEVGAGAKNALQRSQTSDDTPAVARASPRPGLSEHKHATENFMQPRAAPAPPPVNQQIVMNEHGVPGADSSEPKTSPKLPRWSNGGDFSMDEDMARILGADGNASNILRRASNIARHGHGHGRTNSVESTQTPSRASHTRSISESTRPTGSPRWTKTSAMEERNGLAGDIASPGSMSSTDEPAFLKRQLRTSEQRVAELERQFNTEKDLKNLNKKLIEKRKTVSVLDTQTEIMIRQLEVLAGYVERAKDTKQPIDPRELEDSAIKDFVQKLERVKYSMSAGIEQLHEERDQAVSERDQALADRDRAMMEFEQLSSKNAQLADMNNEMTHQLQGRFRNQVSHDGRSNGLGIYGDNKGAMGSSTNLDSASMTTGATLVHGDEDAVVEGPTVVQVMKPQVRKFNWKKGSKGLAQGVAKGVNRAVVAFQNDRGERIQHPGLATGDIGVPYNSTQAATEPPVTTISGPQIRQIDTRGEHGRRFFGGGKKTAMPKSTSAGAMPTLMDAAEVPSILFGSDLGERAEFERRQIPAVVTRCIEEVELRGMDQEGIYRKTGGNSQVNMIKDGFDKNENFDISDPDMDITAVTSVLKQYFRKLPIPLLTFDVYERILESNAIPDEAERCDHLRRTFAAMPEKHRDCLEFLMFHLDRVAQRQTENLMTPKNLAVVFAPTIMRDRSIEKEMTDMHAKNLAVQFVIENSRSIFAEV